VLTAVAGLSGVLGCGPSIYETYQYKKEYDPRKHEYVIGVADTVQITVYNTADVSGSGTVRPDGIITLPLIGDLLVAGKTPTQVKAEVKKKLSAYVKVDATINVMVTGFNSYRFVISGQVNHPGSQTSKFYVTVSEAIAIGGGPTKFAGDQVVVMRADAEGHVHEIPVSYKALISGKHPEQDVCIVSGDTIVFQ
jgi:polysaccharide export outer membrane protein